MEIWKKLKNYEDYYEISSLGRIKSLDRYVNCGGGKRLVKGRMLSPTKNDRGYYLVGILGKTQYIHKLMAVTFLNHKPCGHKIVVDHIDNDRSNNRLDNLQLITHRENSSKDTNGTSNHTGVTKLSKRKGYQSAIRHNGKGYYLGYYNCELKAARAYQLALKQIHNGEEIRKEEIKRQVRQGC